MQFCMQRHWPTQKCTDHPTPANSSTDGSQPGANSTCRARSVECSNATARLRCYHPNSCHKLDSDWYPKEGGPSRGRLPTCSSDVVRSDPPKTELWFSANSTSRRSSSCQNPAGGQTPCKKPRTVRSKPSAYA